jgi:hypothetical protein
MTTTVRKETVQRHRQVNEVVVTAVRQLVSKLSEDAWVGTMTDLGDTLVRVVGRRNVPETFPKSPSALRVALNRVVRRLRKDGVRVSFGRTTDRSRTRYVRFATR